MDRDGPSNNASAPPAGFHGIKTSITFSQLLVLALTSLHPNVYYILLGLLAKLTADGAFESVCGAINGNPKVVLQFGEAFIKFLGNIEHMTMFITVYGAAQILTLLRSQMLVGMLVLLAPYHYFPPLRGKAPNFSVFCGTFELPIFCFVFLWALVFSLLLGFVLLLVLLISWRKLMRLDRNEVPTRTVSKTKRLLGWVHRRWVGFMV